MPAVAACVQYGRMDKEKFSNQIGKERSLTPLSHRRGLGYKLDNTFFLNPQ